MRQRHYLFVLAAALVTTAALTGSAPPASAQVGNFGYGSSTAAGSGGTPTGPTSLGGIYGVSSSAGSGGLSTGLTNPGTLGDGLSTSAGSGGTATGPTNPVLPQFGGTAPTAAPATRGMSALGIRTPGIVNSVPLATASPPGGMTISPSVGMATAPAVGMGMVGSTR